MPYRRAVRLGLVPGLVLVSLSFPSAANVQRKSDAAQARTAPLAKPAAEEGDAAGDERVVVSSDLISLRVLVTDKFGRSVSGLPRSAFTVFDEKRPQEISLFDEDDSPISVGIVFDLTGSMNEGKMGRAREALPRFMETSHEEDEYFLVTLQDGGAALSLDGTRDHEAVVNRLTQLRGHGATALYDACHLGLNRVLGGAHQRRALLLISDGRDNNSHYTFEELRRALTESDVSIYSISVAEPSNERSSILAEDVLRELAEVTGGKFFQPRSSGEMY